MISDSLHELCTNGISVSSEWAKDPTREIEKVAADIYGKHPVSINPDLEYKTASDEELKRAAECGKWGNTQPSELFLRMYHDVLTTLEQDPLINVTSPSLTGSSGVMPLTIISALQDIIRHMANLIARAESEVFLATNYWLCSDSSTMITNALRELSRRSVARGKRVVVKMMYDRGNVKQAFHNHQPVGDKELDSPPVKIPHGDELPNVDIEVVNYHKPMLGTFHAKFMVVDRKIAVIGSNNIQDNANFEMLTHLEGPIVDSFYDMALLSWSNAMKPPLPMHSTPAASTSASSFDLPTHGAMFDAPDAFLKDPERAAHPGQELVREEHEKRGVVGERKPLLTEKDEHYDVDIAAEVQRMTSAMSRNPDETVVQSISRHLNTKKHIGFQGDAAEPEPGKEYTPYIPHPSHELFPMAMVNRKPWGPPNHKCVNTPQNAAFISALRNAQKTVFIQTPNLNAKRVIPEIIAAVKRGVRVTAAVCLGYNDSGELLPGQNGTNEMIANALYLSLTEEEKKNLDIYNYVAKDMTRPIHDSKKCRSCHIKLMIVDDHVGIIGSGNQDTQSWYQSQECNVMFDNATVCAAWLDGLHRNQNTFVFGAVDKADGCWKDANGNMAEGAIGIDPGRFSWARGMLGAIARVRGTGDF
ncbi:hypothetical protein HDU88_006905 [Geranomyces variabilis]|nr:hypothetical protein HDU88_006905 [Geranomyces variabilis]